VIDADDLAPRIAGGRPIDEAVNAHVGQPFSVWRQDIGNSRTSTHR
jgi:hypothetical protein